MYETFYNLRTKPFALLPDTDFLYAGSSHRTAYGLLEYGLLSQAPFLVLTGDPGMGKTSLLHKLIADHRENHTIGLVTNARYDIQHLLPWILLSIGLSKKQLDPVEAYHTLKEFLARESEQNRRVILIIDEAQSLGVELLEELRLLSNLNDGKVLKLQIILSGQPDLHTLLKRIDMTQFAQRISVDCHLEPLSENETGYYIRHRVQVAGGQPTLFTDRACALVHRLSKGNPRLINQVCDIALTYGFAEHALAITSKLVAQAAFDRSKGGILPLAAREELSALAAAPEDASEIEAPTWPSHFRDPVSEPDPESTSRQSYASLDKYYHRGLALKKTGRLKEAIDMFVQAGRSPSCRLRAYAQAGLCHRALGDNQAAIVAFRTALGDQSAPRKDIVEVQYCLARTLEAVEQRGDALTLYRRIAQVNPDFKDVNYRAKKLAARPAPLKNGKREVAANGSWFGSAIDNIHRLMGNHE